MATDTVKINDIASQLTTASRLVASTDFFWVYMASGSQVKIPAEFVRAYLTDGITPAVNSNGNWEVNGTDTGVKAEGITPKLKSADDGIKVSYDGGTTWTTLVLYSDMDIGLDKLVEEYQKIVDSEQSRADAETARQTAETERASAETARAEAESTRVTEAKASKDACDAATTKANTAATAANESAAKADTATAKLTEQQQKVETAISNSETATADAQQATEDTLASKAAIEEDEATRQANEKTRQANETTRQSQESTRQSQESARVTAEKARATAESARATAESTRESNESTRKTNETARQTAETARAKAETSRADAETARAKAETSRADAETARAKAESSRVTAESSRVSAETSRANAESSRVTAEKSRVTAETSRVTAESARATAETQREKDFASSKSACDTATAACKTQTTECKTQTDLAEEQNQHPTYVGDDNYVYKWDTTTKAYVKTSLYLKGDNGSSPKIVNGTWWTYNDTTGEYENTNISVSSDYELTKAKVEAVLTGDITSHTHSQYAVASDVTAALGKKADQTSLDSAVTDISGRVKKSGDTMTGALIAPSFQTGADDTAYFQTKKMRGEGNASTYYHAVDWGYAGHDQVDFYEYGATWNFWKCTGGTKGGASKVGAITTSGWVGSAALSGTPTAPTAAAGTNTTQIATTAFVSTAVSGKADKATTLAGYGITDAKIESGKITLGSNSITPLTAHQSLADYLKTADADTKYLGKTAKAASAATADTATTAANASKVNNHTVESDVPSDAKFTDTEYIIPTLSAAPTESTLTFTDDDGEARSFRIGHMARVADSDSGHGYKFYQLYDLTSGKAVWGEISGEGGGDSSETVTITLTASDGSSLSGATVTIKAASSGEEIASYTWDGSNIQVSLPAGIEVTVGAAKSGYSTVTQTFVTKIGGSRSVALKLTAIIYSYITLDMTITDPASMVSGDVGGEAIKAIRADSHRYLGKLTASGVLTVCQLMDSDSTKYSDGTAATLTGSEGDVFMIMPRFYTKAEKLSTDKWKIGFAYGGDPGDGWKAWGGDDAIGVYEAYVSSSKVYSYSGKTPTVSVSQADFKTYARNRGTGFSIVKHKHQNIMAFLFYALYGNTNAQAVCGAGTSSYPKTAGQTNSLGMTDTTTSNGNSMSINFMGLENWWGDLFEWEDNVVVDARAWKVTEDDGTVRSAGTAYSSDGYISKMMVGDYLDTIPTAASGSETSGLCDYYYQSSSSSRVVRRSCYGSATYGGLVCTNAYSDSSGTYSYFGSRLAFSGEIVKATSVSAYKALSAIG